MHARHLISAKSITSRFVKLLKKHKKEMTVRAAQSGEYDEIVDRFISILDDSAESETEARKDCEDEMEKKRKVNTDLLKAGECLMDQASRRRISRNRTDVVNTASNVPDGTSQPTDAPSPRPLRYISDVLLHEDEGMEILVNAEARAEE